VLKVSRSLVRSSGALKLFARLILGDAALSKIARENQVELVYSNTVAVLAGALLARKLKLPHVWHVREIVESPAWARRVFQYVVPRLSNTIICNSGATSAWLKNGRELSVCVTVIHNGVDNQVIQSSKCRAVAKNSLGIAQAHLHIVCVGRINRWKGQDLLLQSVARLPHALLSHIRVSIVGDAPSGQQEIEQELHRLSARLGLGELVSFTGFTADPSVYFQSADVVVVPSKLAEPFGRVAIEAMAHGVCVLAAAHGGLCEIVVDNETGLLFTPNDPESLASRLSSLLENAEVRTRLGVAGWHRQQALFSRQAYVSKTLQLLRP
jgi:glycosyltransferase involved in cell wall biosynthesis